MKKNLNVIQIRGIKGIIILALVLCCLTAGFIVFPGWIAMQVWNYVAGVTNFVPLIGIFQGVLLWGIIIASYLTFKKNRIVVCVKTPKGLNEEELKAVFADMKKNSADDKIVQAMLKAREAELKIHEAGQISEQQIIENKSEEINPK